nr:reverse transcriptase domain-containing protein [Tanacetum cinerariifolium]GFA96183.1 reverse transcriptase domain-containing protein [Tanacetum cinerariifolium]
ITNFQQRFDESFSEAWDRFKDLLRACPHHSFSKLHQLDTFYNALNSKDQDSLNSAAGGNFLEKMPCECLAIIESKSKVHYSRNKPVVAKVSTNTSTSGISPDVVELKDMVKALLPDKKVVEDEPEKTKDTVNPTNNGSTKDVQPQVVQSEFPVLISKLVTSPISEPVIALVSASKPNPKTSIPYPSRRNDERNRKKANNQIDKFYLIFKDMSFEISFVDALILMLKFASTLKALIGNKEKLSEMARTLLNEHCSAVLLNTSTSRCKHQFNAIFVWKRLSLPGLTPTYMTLELADHLISRPVGVAEDVYVKCEAKSDKSSIDEPLALELKDLPPHLEYAFLEGDNKLPAIIEKVLSVEEKTTLITVLKSHKRAITWKLYDIKGIDPEFYTHKILMEEDFELAVQHQRRVNPKIHDVI